MSRLTARFWVDAYLARLRFQDIPAFVTAHGDDTAGAVLVKCVRPDGSARLYAREWDFDTDTRPWQLTGEGPEARIDETIRRQRGFDPDLWVIEIESRDGRTLLDEVGLD